MSCPKVTSKKEPCTGLNPFNFGNLNALHCYSTTMSILSIFQKKE